MRIVLIAAILIALPLTAANAEEDPRTAYVSACIEEITSAGEDLTERVLAFCIHDVGISADAVCNQSQSSTIVAAACQRFILEEGKKEL